MVKQNKISRKKILLVVGVIFLILIGIFRNQIKSMGSILFGVTIDKAIDLTSNEKDSFNIALLGIGGGTHDGPELTDTIIVANVNVKQNKVHMFSIPRDLWVPDVSEKVNVVYAKAQKNNNGISASKETLERITGLPIDYVVVLDFEGFTKLVDYLGGIDVNVSKGFSDPEYPITGKEDDACGKAEEELESLATASSQLEAFPCRYKTISFEKGIVHMDGESALEYVRSRHGTNGEGSDFARSRRQQEVIAAIREKALSLGVLLNPIKLVNIFNILNDNIRTDIHIEKIDDFIKLGKKLQNGKIESYVIDQGNETEDRPGLLVNPPITQEYGYRWVLAPRKGNGNFGEIHDYIKCSVDNGGCLVGETGILLPTPSISPTSNSR